MVSRIQNRNTGYSENLFSQNPRVENNTFGSIDGATALKLDESFQLQEEEHNSSVSNFENEIENENLTGASTETEKVINDITAGVSIESASYIEGNNYQENKEEEYTPKLFSEGQDSQLEEISTETTEEENKETDQLFDQEINEEEDFEIPAFLRKQKF